MFSAPIGSGQTRVPDPTRPKKLESGLIILMTRDPHDPTRRVGSISGHIFAPTRVDPGRPEFY